MLGRFSPLDRTCKVDRPSVKKELLGQRRLTCIGVGNDGEGTPFFYLSVIFSKSFSSKNNNSIYFAIEKIDICIRCPLYSIMKYKESQQKVLTLYPPADICKGAKKQLPGLKTIQATFAPAPAKSGSTEQCNCPCRHPPSYPFPALQAPGRACLLGKYEVPG